MRDVEAAEVVEEGARQVVRRSLLDDGDVVRGSLDSISHVEVVVPECARRCLLQLRYLRVDAGDDVPGSSVERDGCPGHQLTLERHVLSRGSHELGVYSRRRRSDVDTTD